MSILIKGMEMPTSCGECKLAAIIPIGDYDTYSICPPLHRHIDKYTDTRRTNCPLIEIPPHGDLIDRDAVYKRIHKAIDDDPQLSDVYVEDAQIVTEWLRTEPIIIESEE